MEDQEIAEKVSHLSDEELALYRLRHSLAHVMADAVRQLYPGTKLGFGPPIDNGFYYDFDLPVSLAAEALPKIEKAMRRILSTGHDFVREDMDAAAATERIAGMDEPFKLELARELEQSDTATISFYSHGEFTDVCEGPHVASTRKLRKVAFKLDSIAGAYWRGSENNKMLTRIYGLAFQTKGELKEFVRLRELAKARDHRKLGADLDLFHIDEEVGVGLPLWLPNGTVLREQLEQLARDFEFQYGYKRVSTPDIAREELYYRSGHLPYYADSMFPPMTLVEKDAQGEEVSKDVFYLRPMNCPHHHKIFSARPHSYRDLPLRLSEHGHDYRYEKSGELAGLLRVRGMTMNDAHIYVPEEQAKEEFKRVMELHLDYYRLLEFSGWHMRLSLSDESSEKFIPRPDLWKRAETICIEAMDEMGLDYEAVRGEAAFYGPKVDVQVKNVVGREETASTNQMDPMAAQEDRFDLTFTGKDGHAHRPFVIHRAPLGTHERFVAFLIEHFGGAFPTWLAPVQVCIIPVSTDQQEYAETIRKRLFESFVRVETDDGNDSFNKRIRRNTTRKIPILLIVGNQEQSDGMVTVRRYTMQKQQQRIPFDEFVTQLLAEIRARKWVK
ncbi:MAG: threonine--tRNA ligase [Deltaproteobacteria bacterium]|nr:MAG: threonine--tRNA ligase [Deltaproteobacteria bacterium]